MKEKTAQFRIIENGPLEVSGNFTIVNFKGEDITLTSPSFLCRCGHSSNKPFCDGSHRKNGFAG